MRWYEVVMKIWGGKKKSTVQVKEVIKNRKPQNYSRENETEKYDEYGYYFQHLKDAVKQAEFLASVENIEIEWIWEDDDIAVA